MAFKCSDTSDALRNLESELKTRFKSTLHPALSIVFFDIEATGLEATCEIIQIAAKCGDKIFNVYVVPEGGIPQRITDLTGLSLVSRMMQYHGNYVEGVSKFLAAERFLNFLGSIGEKVVLVAHNCFFLDGPMIAGLMDKLGKKERFKKYVHGFADSLQLFRKYLPERGATAKEQYKLAKLAADYLTDEFDAHSAISDVVVLEKLVRHKKIRIDAADFVRTSKIVGEMIGKHKRRLHYLAFYDDW